MLQSEATLLVFAALTTNCYRAHHTGQRNQQVTYRSLQNWFAKVVFLGASPSLVFGQRVGTSVRQVSHLIRENVNPVNAQINRFKRYTVVVYTFTAKRLQKRKYGPIIYTAPTFCLYLGS